MTTRAQDPLIRRHFRWGWGLLSLYLTMGLLLEGLHGLKVQSYLSPEVESETRRLMWTLSHSHGTLLALVQIAFAVTVAHSSSPMPRAETASRCLIAAAILMPAGFFLGGLFTYGADPGLGVFLVVPGGLLLLIAVVSTFRSR